MNNQHYKGSIDIQGFSDNAIFDLNNPLNRDDGFKSWISLREAFSAHDISLDTADQFINSAHADFELHLDCRPTTHAIKSYLLMLESHLIKPLNAKPTLWQRYNKVFTWRDDLVDGKQFIKINYPQQICIPEIDGWQQRQQLCCLIAGNKSLARSDNRDLYVERIKTIQWFEKHAKDALNLYGTDWDLPMIGHGFTGKVLRVLFKKLKRVRPFKKLQTYKGKLDRKSDALLTTKFNICYENVADLPGYITEKIFDSFFYGCVPVYWGASNITQYIPANCFIDRKQFKNTAEMYAFLNTVTETEYIEYQRNIVRFLQSDQAQKFSTATFVNTIVDTVTQDLEHLT